MSTPGCPVCSAPQARAIETVSPPYVVYVCRACDTGFVHPQPDLEALSGAYASDYYAPWESERARRENVWLRRLQAIASGLRAPVLDVGCGDGGFLRMLCQRHVEAEGTEFSTDAATDVANELGIVVHAGELVDMGLQAERFRTVTMWHTLEHMRDPLGTLLEAHRILAPGGTLVVAVPNREDVVFRAFYRIARRRRLVLFSPNDRELHLFHFTPASLRHVIEAAGFESVAVRPDLAHIDRGKRLIERLAVLISTATGQKWWNAQLATARKPRG